MILIMINNGQWTMENNIKHGISSKLVDTLRSANELTGWEIPHVKRRFRSLGKSSRNGDGSKPYPPGEPQNSW